MPMFSQTDLNPHLVKRYRPLAGPFREHEAGLMEGILDTLKGCNARVLTVSERRGDFRGVSIYRLRAEWISMEETRMRQKLARC